MKKIDEIRDLIQEHRRIEEAIRIELINLFENSPENLEIERISKNPNCFTVSLGSIGNYSGFVLSPEFYNFQSQWQRLQKILRSDTSLERQMDQLTEVAETGKIKVNEKGQKYTMQIHPAVIERLKTILAA